MLYLFNWKFVDQIDFSFLRQNVAWLGVATLKNSKHLKKDLKWRLNPNSVASWKMAEFLPIRKWGKKNRTDYYWVMLWFASVVLKHFATQRFDIVQKSLWISCHYDTENYTYINYTYIYSSKLFLDWFFEIFCFKIYIRKYSKQFST